MACTTNLFVLFLYFPNSRTSNQSSVLSSVKRATSDDLWRHSREPLKAPLLQKLQKTQHEFEQAVNIFTLILKYMGDLPRTKATIDTDHIFGPAMQNDLIRDEVYCQLMKQLTENRAQASEERGWDLMWLAAGVMIPSAVLLKEVTEFLKSRRQHPIAVAALARLQKNLKSTPRKHPPYIIEVEAIQIRSLQIYHKIYFPDDTDEAFEIETSTKAKDLCSAIARRLDLHSHLGFSLFVKVLDKAFSVPEEQYIFDFVYELVEWLKDNQPTRTTADQKVMCHYQLFFMKKLWINAVPGRDPNADHIFYYPQEVPKYLNGYYSVSSPELACKLGALVYRVKHGSDETALVPSHAMLQQLIPEDIVMGAKATDWYKGLMNAYRGHHGRMSQTECKDAFLGLIKEFPTFGSTFFVVKQTTDQALPTTLIIAINRRGVDLVHPITKLVIVHYDYKVLNFWSSGNTYFQIRFGNMIGSNKLLCETSQGYKIDDLLTSYIQCLQTK